MHISQEDVEKIALISRIALKKEEIEEHTEKLNDILKNLDSLDEIDTKEVEPLIHILPIENVVREDEVGETLEIAEVLENAPDAIDRMFKVPKIM